MGIYAPFAGITSLTSHKITVLPNISLILKLIGSAANSELFSFIQVLLEINFGESRSCKTAVFALFGAMNFVQMANFSLQKMQIYLKIKIKSL